MSLWNFFKFSQTQKRSAVFLVSICTFSLATPNLAPASAQATKATVQEILDGDQVFIQNKRASVNDVANQKQQVRTGQSRTALLFNTGAVARLSANSVLSIGQCARLRRGTILINGAVNACSASITTGVRGTTYLLEVDESGDQQVKVLEGEVVVTRNATPLPDEEDELPATIQTPKKPSNNSSKPKQFSNFPTLPQDLPQSDPQKSRPLQPLETKPVQDKPILQVQPNSESKPPDQVVLKAGEKVAIAEKGDLGIIQQIAENEFVSLLTGNLFNGFTNQIPGINKVRDVFNGLFPGVNFPISLPNIPLPNIPIPNLPRFPF
ncbi:hypothetical protein HCU40_09170 [Pseudanabaena biceps]|nr:hypothetical protein [Pseudanabaena biceps]